jgi:hypothetical protein
MQTLRAMYAITFVINQFVTISFGIKIIALVAMVIKDLLL